MLISLTNAGEVIENFEALTPEGLAEIGEEEALSREVPDYLRCDACMAVATEISRALAREEGSMKRFLYDSELLYAVGKASKLWDMI